MISKIKFCVLKAAFSPFHRHCLLSFKLYFIFWFYVSSHDIAQHAKTHSIKSQFKHFSLDIVVADARLAFMKMRRWSWFSTERKSLCKYILFLLFIYFLIVDFIHWNYGFWHGFLGWISGWVKEEKYKMWRH